MVITQAVTADTIKECAEQFFEHVSVTPTDVYIYFPELTITNEYDLSIDIKGLIVKFQYTIQSDNTVLIDRIQGLRTEMNLIQLLGKYNHSHLPKYHTNGFGNFCLGYETPIREMTENPITDLDMLFATINSYVRNESVEGVPHIKMDTVMDLSSVLTKILSGKEPKLKHIVKFAKRLINDGSLQYQYVNDGILPRVRIKGGDDAVLSTMLTEEGLGVDTSQMSLENLLRLVDTDVVKEDGEYSIPLGSSVEVGGLTFDRLKIIPTQEELNFIENSTIGAGNLELQKTYRLIEALINKYLNL